MPLSQIYGAITNLRNRLYDRESFRSYDLGVPVISVGNITTGGTGKTPIVAFIAEILAESGEKVCILTRGYGRQNGSNRVIVSDGTKIQNDPIITGDEPLELARKLDGKAAVIADRDRVAASIWAREKLGTTVFVLDDAFQHRRVRRDLDIVVIDATDPFGNGKMLPFGRLREPLENLERADLSILSRSNLAGETGSIIKDIQKIAPGILILECFNEIGSITPLEKFCERISESNSQISENLKTAPALAFCGLGNPGNFFDQLELEQFNVAATLKFRDHHFYDQKDVQTIIETAKKSGAVMLLTTAKDAVKLGKSDLKIPCFVVENRLHFENEKRLRDIIRTAVNSTQ
ncbi:MAG: tetraacyldisaccharide 4'-kinase [Pyrinomonadaceae bacterium]|nr:tetraacyldisaccharide 4'-kinase [Pyrinomonadaceae bacterium]